MDFVGEVGALVKFVQAKLGDRHIDEVDDILNDTDEFSLMEADALGGLDTDYIKTTFSPESNQA